MANQCTSCGADLRRVVNGLTGNRMPLDPIPVKDGNIFVFEKGTHKGKALNLSGPLLDAAQRSDDVLLYKSHFATCPDAERHRTRG